MLTKAKLDPRKRCLLADTNFWGSTVLHCAACWHSDPAVFELLIREHPLALCATDRISRTPLVVTSLFNDIARISFFTDTTNALATGDYAALAARVHCDERARSAAAACLRPASPSASPSSSASSMATPTSAATRRLRPASSSTLASRTKRSTTTSGPTS